MKDTPRFFYGYWVVGASLLIMSIMWSVFYAFGVFFKPLLHEFGWTRAMTSGAFSLAAVVSGLLTIAMGGLTDRFGPRMVVTLCGLLLGAGFLLMSQMDSLFQLYLFYGILIGAGMSGSFIPFASTVARWFIQKRGLMTGIVVAGSGVGALIGPPVASRLIPLYGWRMSYAIMGGLILSGVALFAQFIRKDPEQVGQVPYGESDAGQKEASPGVDGFTLRQAVSSCQFWIFFCTGFCYGYCVFALMVHVTPHAIELGISAVTAANILAAIGAFAIVGKVLWGRLGDMIGKKRIMILGFAIMSVALILLAPAEAPWLLISIGGVFGFAYGSIAVCQPPLIAELFGLRSHGLIFGAFALSISGGAALGPYLTGYLFDFTDSYRMGFVLCAAISLTGILLSLLLKTGNPSRSSSL